MVPLASYSEILDWGGSLFFFLSFLTVRSLAGEDFWFFNGPVRPVLTASFWAGGNFWFFNGLVRPVLKLRSHAVEDLCFLSVLTV